MKGVQGLIVAGVLGLAGAAVNFYYLHTEAQKTDVVEFIGIKKGAIIGRGEKLTEDNLVKVEIPKNHVGNLKDFAYLWDVRKTVFDTPVWRTMDSNSEGALLLMQSDVKTPPKELALSKGEMTVGIPVSRAFPTGLINPGDKVYFRVATSAPAGPTPAAKPAPAAVASGTGDLQPQPEPAEAPLPPLTTEDRAPIGPFVVVSIGNRLESVELMKASKIAPAQENELMIRVSKSVAGEVERVNMLLDRIHANGSNSYDIMLSKE